MTEEPITKSILDQYCRAMREIKQRIKSVEWALNVKIYKSDHLTEEFCQLQFRLIYELIALACIVAHGDIAQSQRIRKESSAGAIIAALDRLQANFFPWPVSVNQYQNGNFTIDDREEGDFLTKEEMLKLYGNTGNFLHRGSYRSIVQGKRLRPVDFNAIRNQAQRIYNLLGTHSIAILREKHHGILCGLNMAPDGRVSTMFLSEL